MECQYKSINELSISNINLPMRFNPGDKIADFSLTHQVSVRRCLENLEVENHHATFGWIGKYSHEEGITIVNPINRDEFIQVTNDECTARFGGCNQISACRVNSEDLKGYSRESIELLLDSNLLKSIYWPDEPLDASKLTKATGINITLAETHYKLGFASEIAENGIEEQSSNSNNTTPASPTSSEPLVRDIFIACSINRDRTYTLSMDLELNNPFNAIDVYFEMQSNDRKSRNGHFRVHLVQSAFLVQLSQKIRYDECLAINYVQLSQSSSFDIECINCNEEQGAYLDKTFNKRMSQVASELDSLLSEKLLIGLQMLLNQQRLELGLYL